MLIVFVSGSSQLKQHSQVKPAVILAADQFALNEAVSARLYFIGSSSDLILLANSFHSWRQ
jgi:hypothetical protein